MASAQATRRTAVLVVVLACAMALLATSPRDQQRLTDEVTGRVLAAVTIAPWTTASLIEVEQVFDAAELGGDQSGGTAAIEVHVLGGAVDDGTTLPLEIPVDGVPLGIDGRPRETEAEPNRVVVRHPEACDDSPCHRRFRVRVLRPEELPPERGMDVRLGLSGSVADTDGEASLPADAEVTLATTAAGGGEPILPPPDPTATAELSLTLPQQGGLEDLPAAVTFRRSPHRTAPVLVSVVGDGPGTVVLDHGDPAMTLRIPVGGSSALDPFGIQDGGASTESYTVALEATDERAERRPVTVEFRVPDGVTVGRGHAGVPFGEHLEFRRVDWVTAEAEGTATLSPADPQQVVAHDLQVSDAGAPFTGSLVVGVGVSASHDWSTVEADVRVELTPGYARHLTRQNSFESVGRHLVVEVVEGVSTTPIELSMTLEENIPTVVQWDLTVLLDPLRTDTPAAVEAALVPTGS